MRSRAGFTLIELMIVVVVIGILAALAIPRFEAISRSSKQAEARPILKEILTLEDRYKQKNDVYALDVSLLEGGPTLPGTGKYFTFSVADHASGICAIATPNAAGVQAGLDPESLDANMVFYATSGC